MIIRKANLTDIEQLSLLFDAYRVFYEKESDIDQAMTFLTSLINNNESEIFVSFTDEGKMTGFVQLYPIFSSTRMKRLWLLNDLFVLPSHREKGISKALIAAAKDLCIQTNSCGMILETAKTNIVGNNLYPATGFELDLNHNYYSWDV